MEKLLEIGLSGWLVAIITFLFGSGFVVWQVFKRKTHQTNIKAGGDIAGGDIIKGKVICPDEQRISPSKKVTYTVQKNIVANGDVAGGDIHKVVK